MEYVGVYVDLPKDVGVDFEHAYEFRPPELGEYFLTVMRYGQSGMVEYRVVQADKQLNFAFFILKRVKPCLTLV